MIASHPRVVSGETAASISRKDLTSLRRRGSIASVTARDPTKSAANPSHPVRLFFFLKRFDWRVVTSSDLGARSMQ
jgi:hypothetical protein